MMLAFLLVLLVAAPKEPCIARPKPVQIECKPGSMEEVGPVDLATIADTSRLASIWIERHPIRSLVPLGKMPALEALRLDDVPPVDLAPIGAARALKTLHLGGVDAGDLAFVAPLPALVEFELYDGKIASFVGLRGKTLEKLSVYQSTVVAAVLGDVTVAKLWWTRSGARDLTFLSGVRGLRALTIEEPGLTSLAGLERLQELDSLTIFRATELVDLSAIARLPKLRKVVLVDLKKADPATLRGLRNLTELGLNRMPQVNDITWLAALPELTRVALRDTSVADLGVLRGLTKLEYVGVSRTPVKDLSPLVALPALTILAIEGTPAATSGTVKAFEKARPRGAPRVRIDWQ